jgi:lipopolysaccharide transport system permease protein
VLYRDVAYVLPFFTQFWMFISPVIYPSSLVPEQFRLFYYLNPMTGVIEGFRWAMLGVQTSFTVPMLLSSVGITILVLVSGLFYFRRMERLFADMV